MNILMVNYEWPPLGGGGGVAMCGIATELAKHHRIHVLTSGTSGLPKEETSERGNLTVFRCRVLLRRSKTVASIPSMTAFYPLGIIKGRQLVRRYGYDVVNTWFAIPSGPTGVHVARYGRLPHLLTIIGGDIYDPSKWYSPHRNLLLGKIVRSVLRKADRRSAISKDVAEKAREFYNLSDPLEVVPLGIKEPQFSDCGRESLGLQEDTTYIISVGRLVRRKGYPCLIRALRQLDRTDVELIVLGDGPELGSLKAVASSLGVSERVQFRGFVSEETKYQLLSNADVFALVSLHEGFGLVYLEAMHCGLPVVAGKSGGQGDFLKDGETGFLVPVGDVEALKSALQKLVENPRLRDDMSGKNKLMVKDSYVSRTAAAYEKLLQQTRNICATAAAAKRSN